MKRLISKARGSISDNSGPNRARTNSFHSSPSLPQGPQPLPPLPPPEKPTDPFLVPPSSQSRHPSATPLPIRPPTATECLRYRYQHGVNLGSIFVVEKWLFPSMFPPSCPGDNELAAIRTCLAMYGLHSTKSQWATHWKNAVSDIELAWLAREARITAIRLPVGYYTLGPEFCVGTPFADEDIREVYEGAWEAVKELVGRARAWGIGVLLDFHALPGGANAEVHSGTGSGIAGLWGDEICLSASRRALRFMATEIRDGRFGNSEGWGGVLGLQLCNEAANEADGMYEWYEQCIEEIGAIDETIPIYVSDGWDLTRALDWSNKRRMADPGPKNPVIIDTHRYYTFSDSDRSQAPAQIIGRIGSELDELNGREGSLFDRGEGQVIVGEWSCVLDEQTWARVSPSEKPALVKLFAEAQARQWAHRAAGNYFWTLKMEWMNGNDWGFVDQIKQGHIQAPPNLALSPQEVMDRSQAAQMRRADLAKESAQWHDDYWRKLAPGKRFKHHLYGEGWQVGFSDAQAFFTMRVEGHMGTRAAKVGGGDKIGALDGWIKKRMLEAGIVGNLFGWEWEQGMRAGIKGFYECVGM